MTQILSVEKFLQNMLQGYVANPKTKNNAHFVNINNIYSL